MINRGVLFTTAALVVLSFSPGFALDCPKFPEQAKKDWEVKVSGEVAKIGPLKGAELKTTTRSATRDLFVNLPDAGRVYLEQMMFAAYCSTLRDDKTLPETEKSKRLRDYIREVRRTITVAKSGKTGSKKPPPKNPLSGEPKNFPSSPSTEKSVLVTSLGQTGGITAQNVTQNVTIIDPRATDSKPVLFAMTDPNLLFVKKYLIPKNIGTKFTVGECPSAPCFLVELSELHAQWEDGADGNRTAPHAVFSLGGMWDGISGYRALGQGVTLKEGCGARVSTGYYDFLFEIISDRATTLEAWAAVLNGTLDKGHTKMQGICP